MMNDLPEAKNAIVIVYPNVCHHCLRPQRDPYDVRITSIESIEEGWIACGKGHYNIERMCYDCGALYRAIAHAIPIQCAPFPCPKCDELQNLSYNIRNIKTFEDSFEFEIEIECNKCKKKKSLTKLLKKALEVIRIEVKPTGITIRNA